MSQSRMCQVPSEFSKLRDGVQSVHVMVDVYTERLVRLLGPQEDATRRAEEAGAALHRLEWALERLEASNQTASPRMVDRGDVALVAKGGS